MKMIPIATPISKMTPPMMSPRIVLRKRRRGNGLLLPVPQKGIYTAFCNSIHSSYDIKSITGNLCVKSQTKSNLSNFPRHPLKLLDAVFHQQKVYQNVRKGGLIRVQAASKR